MAAVITDIEIGTAFGATAATAPLVGLVSATLDRVDADYAVEGNDGVGTERAQRFMVLVYEPPGNVQNLAYYDNQGAVLNVKRVTIPARTYSPKILKVREAHVDRGGTYQVVVTIILSVSIADLEALLSQGL